MIYENGKVKDINIAYIGGGSTGWAWKLMSDLAIDEELSGMVKLYDIDYEAALRNEIIGNSLKGQEDVKSEWTYKAVKTYEELLVGADFVVISILPGTLTEMASDVHLPEKYGIYQSVGDSTGPGGLIRSLRAVPMFAEFAENIKRYSPNAWVINYTNPMTVCTWALYKAFPGIKAFGCCHGVFGTQKFLLEVLKELKGIEVESRNEIIINVLGINHFTWIDKASYRDIDLMPLFKEFAEKYFAEGYIENKWGIKDGHRVQFDLFKKFGLIAAGGGDRHISEFMPPWYLKNPETVNKWEFELTPVNARMKGSEEKLEKAKRIARGEEKFEVSLSGEEGVMEMKALLGLSTFLTNVNLPNYGQTEGIPHNAVVETFALFSKDSVRPVLAGRMPLQVEHLVIRHVLNFETIIDAALHKDKELAFSAFINDPQVSTLTPRDARNMFEEMLANTKAYLPGWDI